MYAIVHGLKGQDKLKPFLTLTTDKEEYGELVRSLQDDIKAGGNGDLLFHGEIDNVDFRRFWVMTFNK